MGVQHFASTSGANGGGHSHISTEEDDILPIGAVYMSIDNTDPAIALGYGTWLRFAQGRMLIGVDDNDSDFNSAGDTGGQKAVTPAGTVSQPTFTGSSLGTHSHTFSGSALGTHSHTFTGDALANHLHTVGTIAPSAHAGASVSAHANHTHGIGTIDCAPISAGTPAGTVSAHAHDLPFSLVDGAVANSFRKLNQSVLGSGTARTHNGQIPTTATTFTSSVAVALSATATPTFTGSALATHDHTLTGSTGNESASLTHSVTQPSDHTMSGSTANASAGTPSGTNASISAGTPAGTNSSDSAGTPAGTVSQPTFSGSPHTLMNPFFAVFMFRRTA